MTIAVSDTLQLKVLGEIPKAYEKILTPEALGFLAFLELKFREKRFSILVRRQRVQQQLEKGELKLVLAEVPDVRGNCRIAAIPEDLEDRRSQVLWIEKWTSMR